MSASALHLHAGTETCPAGRGAACVLLRAARWVLGSPLGALSCSHFRAFLPCPVPPVGNSRAGAKAAGIAALVHPGQTQGPNPGCKRRTHLGTEASLAFCRCMSTERGPVPCPPKATSISKSLPHPSETPYLRQARTRRSGGVSFSTPASVSSWLHLSPCSLLSLPPLFNNTWHLQENFPFQDPAPHFYGFDSVS